MKDSDFSPKNETLPEDDYSFGNVKNMTREQLSVLCEKLRNAILGSVSRNGGHLASNLGVVELTVALHRVFDFPEDKIIFDVGHQSYVHKLLSGREKGFAALRNLGGVSGFQLRSESGYDFFGGGHSGTSVSAALGFAEAEKLDGGRRYAIAVVGDGSFTNGMIYEAMNNASKDGLRLIIVINDNDMSISKNVGGMSRYFGRLRTSVGYYRFKRNFKSRVSNLRFVGKPIAAVSKGVKNAIKTVVFKENFFENLGIDYIGPVDGHDIARLEAVFREARLLESPVVVHVCTKKGKGYKPAENNPAAYHSVSEFDIKAGIVRSESNGMGETFSERFGRTLTKLAEDDKDIVAITAAMCEGTGLDKFKRRFPERFFDVGIAEEHAATFAAGLAASGKKPVLAVYSSFLQRAYDQIIHDISAQSLHVVLAVDRAGFVPGDGITHQGIFDCAFLMQVPGMTIYTPETLDDAEKMIIEAVSLQGPVAVRYPRGGECKYPRESFKEKRDFRYAEYGSGKRVTFITYGRTVKCVYDAAQLLKNRLCVRLVCLKKVKPLDYTALYEVCRDSSLIVFCEEQIKSGGVSEKVISELAAMGLRLPRMETIAVNESFPPHASLEDMYKIYGLDGRSLANNVESITRC